MHLKLGVKSWSAWSPDRTRISEWQTWANCQHPTGDDRQPDIDAVPSMQRRRMSSLSRMAIATAIDCCCDDLIQPCCIFASRHGELVRTVKIIKDIINHDDVSPTDFSLSVHNTALGLFSIFTKNRMPSTTIVGGEDTFCSALIEAQTYMLRSPETPVLIVFFDEPLPEPLNNMEMPTGEAFSIAFLLSADIAPDIEVTCEYNDSELSEGKNLGLEFLKFYLSGAEDNTVSTKRCNWTWGRL